LVVHDLANISADDAAALNVVISDLVVYGSFCTLDNGRQLIQVLGLDFDHQRNLYQ